MTNFEKIKAMNIDELAEFIKTMVDENETHDVCCYGCIDYGTHHSDKANKGTSIYTCSHCENEGLGLDIVKWLNKERDE